MSDKIILESVTNQRKEIQRQSSEIQEAEEQKSEEKKQINKSIFILERISLWIVGGNYLTTGILFTPFISSSEYWMGFYLNICAIPSLYCVAGITLGINLATLITRQGLNMFTPLSSLKEINLTNAPMSYYL